MKPVWALAALPLALLALVLVVHGPYLSHDVAMYVQVGERLVAGQRVYIDLFELNPPLVMWLSAVPAAVARTLGVSGEAVVAWGTWAFVAASGGFACHRMRGRVGEEAAAIGLWLWGGLHLWYFVEWGQREQLFVCIYLVYTAMALRPGPWPWRLAVGLLLGLIGCLKPHFVALVAGVELLQLGNGRGLRARPWVELGGATLSGLGYVAALALMAPAARDYLLHELMPMVSEGYHRFGGSPSILARSPWLWAAPLLAIAHLRWGAGEATDLSRRLVSWGVVALVLFLQQGKFWVYHQLPVAVPVVLGLGLGWWQWGLWRRPAGRVVGALVAFLWVLLPAAMLQQVPLAPLRLPGRMLAGWIRPGDHVQLYSMSVGPYHTLAEAGVRNERAYLWDYPLALQPVDGLSPSYVASLRADLAKEPDVVLLNLVESCPRCPPELTLEASLQTLGLWSVIQRDYAPVGEVAGLRVFRRR